jgi:hypothetical protein
LGSLEPGGSFGYGLGYGRQVDSGCRAATFRLLFVLATLRLVVFHKCHLILFAS